MSVTTRAFPEEPFRIWAAGTEHQMEGSFSKELLGDIMVEDKHGKKHRIYSEDLSPADLTYIQYHIPPKLEVDVNFDIRMIPRTEWTRANDDTAIYTFTVTVERKSRFTYKGRLTAELFIIGRERVVGNDDSRFVLMSCSKEAFVLPQEGKTPCVITSFPTVPFHAYLAEWIWADSKAAKRGKDYLGWILTVSDPSDRQVCCESDIRVDWLTDDIPHTVEMLRTLYEEYPGHFESRHFNEKFEKLEPPRIPWFKRRPDGG